jgi:hypothetical protein
MIDKGRVLGGIMVGKEDLESDWVILAKEIVELEPKFKTLQKELSAIQSRLSIAREQKKACEVYYAKLHYGDRGDLYELFPEAR